MLIIIPESLQSSHYPQTLTLQSKQAQLPESYKPSPPEPSSLTPLVNGASAHMSPKGKIGNLSQLSFSKACRRRRPTFGTKRISLPIFVWQSQTAFLHLPSTTTENSFTTSPVPWQNPSQTNPVRPLPSTTLIHPQPTLGKVESKMSPVMVCIS